MSEERLLNLSLIFVKMRITFVRHGETTYMDKGLCQGQGPASLSQKGFEQARAVARRLSKEKFDYVYSSDLPRAVETAREIMKYHLTTRLIQDPGLREINAGIHTGKPWDVAREARTASGLSEEEWASEGGENRISVWKRSVLVYEELKKKHPKDSILIVGHGLPISSVFCHLEGIPIVDLGQNFQKPTGVSVLEVDSKGNHKILISNCTKHLDEIDSGKS